MAEKITDQVLEGVGILAQLDITEANQEAFRNDLSAMLEHIDKLNEVDTESVDLSEEGNDKPNVFREDVVTNADRRDEMLQNAPEQRDGMFLVPPTFE